MIDIGIVFRKNSSLHLEYMNDYGILIPKCDGLVSCLNKVGIQVFELIDGVKTVGEIASILATKYPVEFAIVFDDVANFCNELSNCGHIVELKACQ